MTTQFELLREILHENPRLEDLVFQEFFSKNEALSNLNNLFSFFIPSHRLQLATKIKDTNTLRNFRSLVAELYSARIFAQRGCGVQLLADNYFPGPSPDILCNCHDFSFFVEVTSLSDSEPTLKVIDELRKILREKSFIVSVKFHDCVSKPCFSSQEHRDQEKLLKNSMEQFKSELESLTPDTTKHEIITDSITFTITHSAKPGFPGCFSSCYQFPRELFEKFVTPLLQKKAGKRLKFKGPTRNFAYILSFVSENISVDNNDFEQLLYGAIPEILAFPQGDPGGIIRRDQYWAEILRDKNKHIPKWQEIETASNNEWHDFLTEMHYIPNNFIYLSEAGLFLSDPLMKNVSGILLIRKSTESHFYPNPFCDPEISLVNHQDFFYSFR